MQQRQARETGICPIREELYAQCFDELIRQVTVNCAERGLLVLRVRDEIRMTIAASPLKFGILLFRTEGYPKYFLILYSVNMCISCIFILQNMGIVYNIWVPE